MPRIPCFTLDDLEKTHARYQGSNVAWAAFVVRLHRLLAVQRPSWFTPAYAATLLDALRSVVLGPPGPILMANYLEHDEGGFVRVGGSEDLNAILREKWPDFHPALPLYAISQTLCGRPLESEVGGTCEIMDTGGGDDGEIMDIGGDGEGGSAIICEYMAGEQVAVQQDRPAYPKVQAAMGAFHLSLAHFRLLDNKSPWVKHSTRTDRRAALNKVNAQVAALRAHGTWFGPRAQSRIRLSWLKNHELAAVNALAASAREVNVCYHPNDNQVTRSMYQAMAEGIDEQSPNSSNITNNAFNQGAASRAFDETNELSLSGHAELHAALRIALQLHMASLNGEDIGNTLLLSVDGLVVCDSCKYHLKKFSNAMRMKMVVHSYTESQGPKILLITNDTE